MEKCTLCCNAGCRVNSDIFFLLDGSGSIDHDSAQNMRSFVKMFVNSLAIGPNDNQVGMIIFGKNAKIVFNLDKYDNATDIVQAIDNYRHPRPDYTNTADGLCKLIRGFSEKNGARVASTSVFRFAIVLTDGKSNQDSSRCNNWTTSQAAHAVHSLDPPVLVYAIGVTGSDNMEELETIASSPNGAKQIDSLSLNILQDVGEEFIGKICTQGLWCIEALYNTC